MNNKFVWAIAAIVATYFFMKNRTKKEVKEKVDKAVSTVLQEQDDLFKKSIDSALAMGYDLNQFKIAINTPA